MGNLFGLPGAESLDDRVRREAIAWLTVRTNDGADAIHYLDLEDFEVDGQRLPLRNRYKGIWKPRILEGALSFTTTYRAPGAERPYEDAIVEGLLHYKWKGDRYDDADNRALRRSMELKLPLIWFRGVGGGMYQPVFPVYILDEEPEKQQFVVDIDPMQAALSAGELGTSPLEREIEKRYSARLATVRVHQRVFRSVVMRAYETRCAVCNLRHGELLDAAHIVPDRDDQGIASIVNGMALCKIHHAAFDSQILGIRPDLVVEIRADLLEEIDGPMLRYGLNERHGQRLMAIPGERKERPSRELLEKAYERFKGA